MRINVLFREETEVIKLQNKSVDDILNVSFGEIQTIGSNTPGTTDYNELINKPIINSVVLEGSLTAKDLGLGKVYYDTTANWNAQPSLIAEEAVVYIYSDYTTIEDGAGNQTAVAGIKIGDGTSYLIDQPFITDAATYLIISHISNTGIHVTQAEKEFWNNKVSAYINHTDPECLEISKRYYELNGEIIEG